MSSVETSDTDAASSKAPQTPGDLNSRLILWAFLLVVMPIVLGIAFVISDLLFDAANDFLLPFINPFGGR